MSGQRFGWREGVAGLVLATVTVANLAGNVDLNAPPRYDGAGYAVLARSLGTGQGYREIDHPEAPRHAHFPPGYPVALALLWALTGPSVPAAHVASCLATVAAVLLTWRWFRTLYAPGVALGLGLALACNWRWGRDGGLIRSEPVFLLLSALALVVAARIGQRGGHRRAAGLGILLGAATLTRHVGIALIGAVGLDLIWRGRRREALVAVLVATSSLIPWAVWLRVVGRDTQVGRLPQSGWLGLIADQALFYMQRLPDQVTGPVVEVGTVFRPALWAPMTAWAALATALLLAGWTFCLRSRRRRLAGLVPALTLPILLVWPFTEAGRFLVPLVPFVLVGAVEGLARVLAVVARGRRRARVRAAVLVLIVTVPYSAYAIWTDRAGAERLGQADFDAACAWIAEHATQPGPILTRHPGEVFLQTGRHALAPSMADDAGAIGRLIARHAVAYLLVDRARYANAPADPLAAWAEAHPERVVRVRGELESVAIYAVWPVPEAPAARRDFD